MKNIQWTLLIMWTLLGTATAAWAQEAGGSAQALPDTVKMCIALAAGFGIAIASFGGALGQGRAISSAVEGIARNPGAAEKIFAPALIVGLALIESLVILTFAMGFLLQQKL